MKFADDPPRIPELAREYAAWVATPPSDRDPRTKAEWAEDHEIDPRTLNNWERSGWWRRVMVEATGDPYGLADQDDIAVVSALRGKALTGDTKAIALYMELRGITTKKGAEPTEDPAGMSDEELSKQMERIMSEQIRRDPLLDGSPTTP